MEKNMTGVDAFRILYSEHTEQLRILNRSLKNSIRGTLMVSTDRGKPAFYRITNDGGEYKRKRITSRDTVIYKLANKKYRMELMRRKEYNNALFAKIAEKLLPEDPQSVIEALPKGYSKLDYSRIIDPNARERCWPNPSRDPFTFPERARIRIIDMEPEEWGNAPYCENTKELSNKKHRSRRGILCRSKGEAMLLDLADDMDLIYRYDSVIRADGYEISPDLIIIRQDGKLIYVEHHGWIDRSDGDSAFLRKLGIYANIGIIQGDNLLVTFDKPDGSCDTELIRRQLENIMNSSL